MAPLLALAMAGAAVPALAQVGRVYCNVTEVKATQLSNAVRIDLRCDGQLEVAADLTDYVEVDPRQGGVTAAKPVRNIVLRLTNAKSRVGAFIDVGRYPVSHVEMAPLPDSPDGVGVACTISLYPPGRTNGLRMAPYYLDPHDFIEAGLGFRPGEVRWLVQEADDRRGLVFIVTSDRFAIDADSSPEEEVPYTLDIGYADGLVEVRAVRAPIGALAETIGARTGLRCTVAGDPGRRVSLYVPPTRPERVLSELARSQGLTLMKDPAGPMQLQALAPRDPATYDGTETRLLRLNHLTAEEALGLLPVCLLRYVRPSPEQNALVASGSTELLDHLQANLQAVDLPAPIIEVVVEVLAHFSDRGSLAHLAIDGQAGRWVGGASGEGLEAFCTPVGALRPELEAHIRDLRLAGELDVVTRQRLSITNGSKGHVFVGDQPTIVTSYYDYFENEMRPDLTVVDVGARLEIEPWTGNREDITVHLSPAVSSIRGEDPITGMPVLSVRRAEATVRVRAGEPIVLGGLSMFSDESTHHRLNLPVIQSIFRGRGRTEQNAEFSFVVTPRVL
ncbi:MAG TPA: hypothetical protein PLD23_03330 [Armatimonadota bacterium]|nr:hypothetical protein [Armatimonadota bacterium]